MGATKYSGCNLHMLIHFRQVQIMSTLPLKAMSRLWGRFNELTIPYYLRVPGFKLYSWVFGVKYVRPRSMKPITPADHYIASPKWLSQIFTHILTLQSSSTVH